MSKERLCDLRCLRIGEERKVVKSSLRRIVLPIVALSLSVPAYSEEELAPWLIRENFETGLGLFLTVDDDCPFSKEELETVIEGEFLRARLIPVKTLSLSLDTSVICMKLINRNDVRTGTAVTIFTRYSSYEGSAVGGRDFVKHNRFNMLSVGTDATGKPFILNAVKESVSEALTYYLRANIGRG